MPLRASLAALLLLLPPVAIWAQADSVRIGVTNRTTIEILGIQIYSFPDTVIGADSIPRFSFYCLHFETTVRGDSVCTDAPYIPMCLFYRDDRGPRTHELSAPLPLCDSLYMHAFLADSTLRYMLKPAIILRER